MPTITGCVVHPSVTSITAAPGRVPDARVWRTREDRDSSELRAIPVFAYSSDAGVREPFSATRAHRRELASDNAIRGAFDYPAIAPMHRSDLAAIRVVGSPVRLRPAVPAAGLFVGGVLLHRVAPHLPLL